MEQFEGKIQNSSERLWFVQESTYGSQELVSDTSHIYNQ